MTSSGQTRPSRRSRTFVSFFTAAVVALLTLSGCTGDPADPLDTPSSSPGTVVVPGDTTSATPTPGTTGQSSESASSGGADDPIVQPADPADDYPDEGGMTLPTVEPNVSSTFCQAYTEYLNAGGPYTLQEAGSDLPPFTKADLDAYAKLQATAPADIKSQVDKMAAYGAQMNKGDFTNGIEYENLLSGPGGLILYALVYCQLDNGVA